MSLGQVEFGTFLSAPRGSISLSSRSANYTFFIPKKQAFEALNALEKESIFSLNFIANPSLREAIQQTFFV